TAELVFDDCRIPAQSRIGEEGQGFKIAMTAIDGGRIGIAAQAVGIATGAYERSVAYARERKAFGVIIGEHQMVQWILADMAEPERGPERPVRFETLSGIPIEPLYTPESLREWSPEDKLGRPGEYPFTRGVYPTMYRGRLWTMRMFAGFGRPEDTNARFKYL